MHVHHGGARQASCFKLFNGEHTRLVWHTTRCTRRTRVLPHVHLTTGIQWLGCWLITSLPFSAVTCFSFLIIIHLCNSAYRNCHPLLIAIVRNAVVFRQTVLLHVCTCEPRGHVRHYCYLLNYACTCMV